MFIKKRPFFMMGRGHETEVSIDLAIGANWTVDKHPN